MPFKEGQSGNPGGRPKGSANKETKKVRDWIGKFLENNTSTLEQDIMSLDPKDRVNSILSLMEYSVPKLARTELVSDNEDGFTINVITHSQAKKKKSAE